MGVEDRVWFQEPPPTIVEPTSVDIIRRNFGGTFPRVKDAVTPERGVSPILLGYGILLVVVGAWLTAMCHNGSPLAIDDLPVLASGPDGRGVVLPVADEDRSIALALRVAGSGPAAEQLVERSGSDRWTDRDGPPSPAADGLRAGSCGWLPQLGYGAARLESVGCLVQPAGAPIALMSTPATADGSTTRPEVVLIERDGFPRHASVGSLLLGLMPLGLGLVCAAGCVWQAVTSIGPRRRYCAYVQAAADAPSLTERPA